MTTTREGSAIAKKQLAQRQLLWPDAEPWLWHRLANKGFATIPKTMPIILQIMDDLSNGRPVSSTYLGLWCDTWDNSLVNTSKHAEFAHAAGFTGQRAAYTWAARVKILQDLQFIDVKPGRSGPISHVLIWNPHRVIRWHHEQRTPGLVEANFNALLERAVEIGAKDMLDDGPPEPAAETVAPAPASAVTPAEADADFFVGADQVDVVRVVTGPGGRRRSARNVQQSSPPASALAEGGPAPSFSRLRDKRSE